MHPAFVLASLFDIRSHSLRDCTAQESLTTLEAMAETTPLLPRPNRSPHDLQIFLRVCHSPWLFINQGALLAIRAIIAAFLTVAFTLDIFYGINDTRRGKQLAFEASNISLVIQIFYYWITTVGVSPLRWINPLISATVLDLARYRSTLWSIASRRKNQGQIPNPRTSRSLGPHIN